MLHPPGFYFVKKPKRFVILSSEKSSERNLSSFFDIKEPRRMEHLQSEEPFSSDPYFREQVKRRTAWKTKFFCKKNGPKLLQVSQTLSAQFVCPSPKVLYKRLYLVSVVLGQYQGRTVGKCKNLLFYEFYVDVDIFCRSTTRKPRVLGFCTNSSFL